MYGPDEDDRIESAHHRAGGSVWLVLVTLGLLGSAFAWGLTAPLLP